VHLLEIVVVTRIRRERHMLSLILGGFGLYSWHYIGNILLRKFLLGFIPHEGFPG
jgi:hypothetical protein